MRALYLLIVSCLSVNADIIRDIPYGDHPLQTIDLYLPDHGDTTPRPVIVAIHGGGWANGDKAHAPFVQNKTQWFNQHGYLVASINYRLSPAVTHPSHVEDVCTAIAWLQQHVAKHGGNPQHLTLLGHSAGAHLAALAGIDTKRQQHAGIDRSGIRGVILLDGAAYDVPRQIANCRLPRLRETYLNAFTHDATMQRDASPALKVANSPHTPPPPYLILHVATRADAKDQAQRLSTALHAQGGIAKVIAIPGKSHRTINTDLGKPGDPTTTAVASFLGILP